MNYSSSFFSTTRAQTDKTIPEDLVLFYDIPKKSYTRIRKPVFKKKKPKKAKLRKIAKKHRKKKLKTWLKFKKNIDYFEEQHETLISYIERDFHKYKQCCELYSEQNDYYNPDLEYCDIYRDEDFYEDTDYYYERIKKNYDFHMILSEVAFEKAYIFALFQMNSFTS